MTSADKHRKRMEGSAFMFYEGANDTSGKVVPKTVAEEAIDDLEEAQAEVEELVKEIEAMKGDHDHNKLTFNVHKDDGHHTHVFVRFGSEDEHRALAGELCFDARNWTNLRPILQLADHIEVKE